MTVHRNRANPRGEHGDGESAVGQVVGFMVAGAIFVAALGSLLLVSQQASTPEGDAAAAGQTLQAQSLLDLLISSGGVGDVDDLQRLGLAANGTFLDAEVLEQMRGASEESDPSNGRVDYDEALDSLALDGLSFHLRIYPVGFEPEAPDLAEMRVAYVGDWLNFPNLQVSVGTQAAMLASAQTKLDVNMASDAQRERAALAALGVNFTNAVHLTAAAPTIAVPLPLLPDPPLLNYLGLSLVAGDVYPDNGTYLSAVLPSRLAGYDIVVIGSSVRHQSLEPNTVKSALADWVVDGGTLVVLGSDEQNSAWLNPLFQAAVRNVNGGPFAPDVAHPMLLEPNDLDWESYDNEERGWDLQTTGSGAHYEDFTHVVTVGDQDILAVSNDGTFGAGRVVITTYQPGDISEEQGQEQAEAFFENIFLYTENGRLYLEYGPTIPFGVEVVTAVRQSSLWDSSLGHVPVRLELHLWRSG